MTSLELGALILATEFALISWVILFVLLRRQRKSIRADQEHVGTLEKELETVEVSRRDALANLFEKTYKLEGDELAAHVDEYVAREKAFYSAMLSIYMERDGEKLKEIPAELAKVLTPWVNLTPSGLVDAQEIGALESEKAELAAELESTKQTLEELMDEYTSAFNNSQHPSEDAPPPPLAEETESEEDFTFEEAIPLEDASPVETPDDSDPPEEDAFPTDDEVDPLLETDSIEIASTPNDIGEAPPNGDDTETASPSSNEPSEEEPTQEEEPPQATPTQEELDREELEGLADLFETPPDKK